MAKHLAYIDEWARRAARARLGAETTKDTVNAALRRAEGSPHTTLKEALDVLARAGLGPRKQAWGLPISFTRAC